MKRIARFAFALLLVLALFATAQAQPRTLLPDDFSDRVASLFTIEVPLGRDNSAKAILVNETELRKHGVAVPAPGADLEKWAEGTFGWMQGKKGSKTVGVATRYHDWWRESKHGSVTGDGRVVLLPDLVVKDAKGNEVSRYRVQVKGVPTGLRPTGVKPGGSHGSGLEDLYTALKEAVYSEALTRNGVPSSKWLSVLSTGRDNSFTYPDGGVHTDPAGIFARSGDYFRIAHLNFFRDDPKALRELVDQINEQVSKDDGRAKPYSLVDLYKALSRRKANELADTFWSRFFHGSTTYDNIAFTEAMDFGTMSAVDRTHASSWRRTSRGFSNEGPNIMESMYAGELYDLFEIAATKSEKKDLAQLDPEKLTEAMLRDRMSRDALEHLGFAPSDVRELMRTSRKDVGEFLDAFDEVGRTKEEGFTYEMGGKKGQEVKDPARYDLFGALSDLVATEASKLTDAAKVARVVKSLDPFGGTAKENAAAARKLLDGVKPLVERVLHGLDEDVKKAKVTLIDHEAKRINASIVELERNNVIEIAKGWVDRIAKGVSAERIRAEFYALVRRNTRRGPDSPAAVSDRLRKDAIATTGKGWAVLTSEKENGVTIDELSSGPEDRVRVTLDANPALGGKPGEFRMRYRFGSGKWQDATATATDGKTATYSVPLADASKPFEAYFVNEQNGDARWDNGGFNFGKGIAFKTASPLVVAELTEWARRNGRDRTTTPESVRKAVATDDASAGRPSRTSGLDGLLDARITGARDRVRDAADGR